MTGIDSLGTGAGGWMAQVPPVPGFPDRPWLLTMHGGAPGGGMSQTLFVPYTSGTSNPEEDMSDILVRLGKVEDKVNAMSVDLATATEKLRHMPTTEKMWVAVGATGAAVVFVLWAAFQFFGPGVFETGVERYFKAHPIENAAAPASSPAKN